MADTIEENRWIILTAMATQQADVSGRISLNGQKIQELTNLKPAEINDAIVILEEAGYVKLMKFLGTTPFLFGIATITPLGKNEYQKRITQTKKNEIQVPSNFTPAMRDMITTSLAMFEDTKSALLSSLIEAGEKYQLRGGLYYIVLIDLSGSTISAVKKSKVEYSKWISEFVKITQESLNFSYNDIAVYFTSSGDGSLFLFRNFDDILNWRVKVNKLCAEHNQKCNLEQKPEHYQYHHKIIVHMGEIYFEEGENNTNSFAVNIVFIIEKQFEKNDLGITEAVKQVIAPEINSGRFGIQKWNDYILDEANVTIPLWKLSISEN